MARIPQGPARLTFHDCQRYHRAIAQIDARGSMPESNEPFDDESTLLRVGRSAVTFPEMESFVHEIEGRPFDQLLDEIPLLMMLPEAKFNLFAMVLRKRIRSASEGERLQILDRVRWLDEAAGNELIQERCRAALR